MIGSSMTDNPDDRQQYVDRFIAHLFSAIGECMRQGDEAEVSVNGVPITTFLPAVVAENPEDVEEYKPQIDPHNSKIVDFSRYTFKTKH